MKGNLDIYEDVIVGVIGIIAVLSMLGGCCVYYREMIEMLLNSIFYK